jgi:nitroreductase
MGNFLELASGRRSIRKYGAGDIPEKDVEYFIKAAVTAPSGCNSQCWRFVAIKDRAVLGKLAQAVVRRTEELLAARKDLLTEQYISSKRKMVGFFADAPLVIAVFMTHLEYYDRIETSSLEAQGYDHEEIMKLLAHPDILSIGAAVQNLLLAVHEKGYGACWMNEPAIAGEDIGNILGIPAGNRFMSLIPIGFPAYTPQNKGMKPMSEVFTSIP